MITIGPFPAQAPATPLVANATAPSSGTGALGAAFGDIVDALNPLQHIPVVSNLYRSATGSSISSVSQIAGDTLYGALTGNAVVSLAASAGDVAVKQLSGSDITQHVVATYRFLTGSGSASSLVADTQAKSLAIAQADSPAAASAQSIVNGNLTASAFFKSLQSNTGVAQYQRVQTLDAANKMLVKMAV